MEKYYLMIKVGVHGEILRKADVQVSMLSYITVSM